MALQVLMREPVRRDHAEPAPRSNEKLWLSSARTGSQVGPALLGADTSHLSPATPVGAPAKRPCVDEQLSRGSRGLRVQRLGALCGARARAEGIRRACRRGLACRAPAVRRRGSRVVSSPYHDFDTVHLVDGKELVRPARLGPDYTSDEMVAWLRAVHDYNTTVAAAHAKAFAEAFSAALRKQSARWGKTPGEKQQPPRAPADTPACSPPTSSAPSRSPGITGAATCRPSCTGAGAAGSWPASRPGRPSPSSGAARAWGCARPRRRGRA